MEANPKPYNTERTLAFVREWLDFDKFCQLFFMQIELELSKEAKNKVGPDQLQLAKVGEWHRRRQLLRELLYLAGEDNLILQEIPEWRRLKQEDKYVQTGGYKTPFAFILDFSSPVAMIQLHYKSIHIAQAIAHEFLEFLSFEYPEVKQLLNQSRESRGQVIT